MLKKWAALLLCLATVAAFTACRHTGQNADAKPNTLRVTVTFDAMKEFAEAVGGDKVSVTTIIPDGTEPHDFEPKAKDLASLNQSKVFVYAGLGMESWAGQAIQAAGSNGLIAVEASKGIKGIAATAEKGQYDPHFWLSLKSAETASKNIEAAFAKADPADSAYFQQNCNTFVSQLESLFNEYDAKFQSSDKKDFVTGHAAFAYMCRDFGLTQKSVEDVFAQGEPSAQKLKELIDYCKKNGVKTIFVEDMVSPAVSQTLASEVGAKVKTIYTIESSEGGKSYLDRMRVNLEEINESLQQ